MSRLLPTEPVRVRIGDCECPGAPHPEGDFAQFRPRLTARGGLLATSIIYTAAESGVAKTMTELGLCFLADGLLSWDLLDDDGKPIPVSAVTGGALDWETTLLPLANKANALYEGSVIRPLATRREPASLPSGPMDDSTSATSDS